MRIILASKSPRRRELLLELYRDFEIITEDVDENFSDSVHPREGVEILAVRKGAAVAKSYPDAVVISSDTLVEIDGVPLGKPADAGEARDMLRRLSGNTHRVHTGVAVHFRGRALSGVSTSAVAFRELSDDEISEYIATGEPMDKAGSYAIQGLGGKFVSHYEGDFDTIVGLSVSLTRELIRRVTEE